jgi:hypothetical protein
VGSQGKGISFGWFVDGVEINLIINNNQNK